MIGQLDYACMVNQAKPYMFFPLDSHIVQAYLHTLGT